MQGRRHRQWPAAPETRKFWMQLSARCSAGALQRAEVRISSAIALIIPSTTNLVIASATIQPCGVATDRIVRGTGARSPNL